MDDGPPPKQPLKNEASQQQHNGMQTLSLSKEELLSLYQAALNKGSSLNISSLPTLTDTNGKLDGENYYKVKNLNYKVNLLIQCKSFLYTICVKHCVGVLKNLDNVL